MPPSVTSMAGAITRVITAIYRDCQIVPLNWVDGGDKLLLSNHHRPLFAGFAIAMVLTGVLTDECLSRNSGRVLPDINGRFAVASRD